ncbi:hypothetical protein STEG23_022476 [Scotinomys teguina]
MSSQVLLQSNACLPAAVFPTVITTDSPSEMVSEEVIMDYYEKYKPRMNELEAFNMLKVVLAPCIETLILLDRLCYLKEQEDVAWSALVKLFDPVQSPRCYAVIALKKQL